MPAVAKKMPLAPVSLRAKRAQQVLWSARHYLSEIARLQNARAVLCWFRYKLPWLFAQSRFPLAVTLEITNTCNYACPHCPRNELNRNRELGFMDPATFRKLVRECDGHVKTIKFIGLGESALHPDLDDMMQTLQSSGIEGVLYTNGTLLARYSPETILDWNLSTIVLSIDGVDARSFNRLRVGGDYQTIRADLARFRTLRDRLGLRGPHIEIRHVIMPNETPQMLRAFRADWLDGLGDSVKFNLLGAPYGSKRAEVVNRPRCRDIRREVHVRYDGRVPLCGYDGQNAWIGDLGDTSLEDIWHARPLEHVRDQHARRDLSELPFCRTCQFR